MRAAQVAACAFGVGFGARVGHGRDPAAKDVHIQLPPPVLGDGGAGKLTSAQKTKLAQVSKLIKAEDWSGLLGREAEALDVAKALRLRSPTDAITVYGNLGHAHSMCLATPVAIYADHGGTSGWEDTAYGNPTPSGRKQQKPREDLHRRDRVLRANFQRGACRMHAEQLPGFVQSYSNAPLHKPEPCRASLFPGVHMEQQQGDAARAIDHYLVALAIARENGDRAGEADICGSVGLVYRKIADYPKAIRFHEARLDIAHELGDKGTEASAYLSLGLCYYSLERFRKAVTVHPPSSSNCNDSRDIDRDGEGKGRETRTRTRTGMGRGRGRGNGRGRGRWRGSSKSRTLEEACLGWQAGLGGMRGNKEVRGLVFDGWRARLIERRSRGFLFYLKMTWWRLVYVLSAAGARELSGDCNGNRRRCVGGV